jgi:vancomycin resistance protein YoaR
MGRSMVHAEGKGPSLSERVVFRSKAALLGVARSCRDAWHVPVHAQNRTGREPHFAARMAESRSLLWDSAAARSERALNAGKVQNLRVAARRLDGCVVPAGQVFSFWRQLGWPGRPRGFVLGRELRQGCLIPSIGGGLCQLSNALYDCARQAGFTIRERHRHSQVVPGSLAEADRDATVFWNYVDLRFSADREFQVRIEMTPAELIVQFWSRDE